MVNFGYSHLAPDLINRGIPIMIPDRSQVSRRPISVCGCAVERTCFYAPVFLPRLRQRTSLTDSIGKIFAM